MNREWLKNILAQCSEHEYRTTPIFPKGYEVNGRKIPALKFGDGQDYKKLDRYSEAAHVGMVLDNLVLLDYDGNKGDIMSVEDLEEVLDLDLVGMPEPAQVNEDGDSIHWLFKLPEGVDAGTLADSCDGAWLHIDIKRGNQLMHLKEGKTLNLLAPDEWEDCPQAILDKLTSGKHYGVDTDEDDDLIRIVEENEERMDFGKLEEVVMDLHLSYAEEHDLWVKVGMGVWYETRGSEEGLELFKRFSEQSEKYDEATIEHRWPSFRNQRGKRPVTGGTLLHFARKSKVLVQRDDMADMKARINNADEEALEFEIAPDIAKGDFDPIRREQLAVAIQARLKEITDVKPSIALIRGMVAPAKGELTEDMPRPDWCLPWVYVGTHGEFFHLDLARHVNPDTFNMEYTRLIPMNENGQKPSAARFVMNHGFIQVADRMEYLPYMEDRLIETEGVTVFNSFDYRSLPKFATRMTDEGRDAVQAVRDHLRLWANGSEKDAAILEQWFAHQVQHRGKKILWAPLICSIEGTGKGLMESLLRKLLGSSNIGVVNPDDVKSTYKASWAIGSCVNILNELKISGANRHEIANALKPMLTDPVIRIQDKHVKAFQARNTANYIAFTNYVDAIPLNQSTRRWWPLHLNIDSLDEMGREVGLSKNEYFDRLVAAIDDQWQQIGLWLSEYEITEEFMALKQAPESQFKLNMVATEDSKTMGLEEAREIIEVGGELIHHKAVNLDALLEAVNAQNFGYDTVTKGDMGHILQKLGFTRHKGQPTILGETRRMWTKGVYSHDEVRAFFE